MADKATIDIPKDVLEPIINAHITKALTEVFGDRGRILDEVVKRVLTAKVDDRGEPDRYNSDRALTTVQFMAHKAVKEAALEAVKEALAQHKDVLKAVIVRELSNSKSKLLKSLAESLVDGVAKAAASGYLMTVQIKERD